MIKRLIVVFSILITVNSFSQEGTASPYSFYGIGSLNFKGTIENRSMGGLSIYTDSIHLNLRNPASYAGRNLASFNNESRPVKFAVGGSSNSVNFKTNDSKDNTTTTTFDYLALGIPMGKFGFGFGLVPFTSVGYKLESSDEDVLTNRYRGNGGVNKAFISLGYQINDNFRIGVDANYNFGNIENSAIEFSYDEEGNLTQYQSKQENRSDLSGLNFNIGLLYDGKLNERLKITSGLTYTPESEITSENDRAISTIVINTFTGEEGTINSIVEDLAALGLDKTELILPAKLSFGLGIGEERKWFAGAEYTAQQTSKFSNRIFNVENATFEDANTIALGGFYIPQYNSLTSYWKRVVYRAGIRYENTGLNINTESIDEFGISFGVGLPVGRLFSNANIGVEIGRRGTTNQNLVQENFVNFQSSLSLNDRWFVKRKYD